MPSKLRYSKTYYDLSAAALGDWMDASLFEQLLYEEEGPTLDFKQGQYPFAKASDEDKSELLKDILGLANSWRRAEAYILIGVQDIRGGRSNVVGISEHLDDHSLQQFINCKTNRPVRFTYEAFGFEDKQVGVIRVDEQQARPVYLERDFGNLKKHEVYVRRGSSTDPTKPAGPDEIALMGRPDISGQADLNVQFSEPDRNVLLGSSIRLQSEQCNMPGLKEIPGYGSSSALLAGMPLHNSSYWKDLALHESAKRLFRPIRFAIINSGRAAAFGVRLELVATASDVMLCYPSQLPAAPTKKHSTLITIPIADPRRQYANFIGGVAIHQNIDDYTLTIECGDIQPGRTIWSDDIYCGKSTTGEVVFTGAVFANNLERPKEVSLTAQCEVSKTSMSFQELKSLGDLGKPATTGVFTKSFDR